MLRDVRDLNGGKCFFHAARISFHAPEPVMLPNQPKGGCDVALAQTEVLSKCDCGLQPELGLTGGMMNVYVQPILLAREEVERKPPCRKTVGLILPVYTTALAAVPLSPNGCMLSRGAASAAASNYRCSSRGADGCLLG